MLNQMRKGQRGMNENKICKTCEENDDGLCDRLGVLVEDNDSCEKHRNCNGCFGAANDDCQKCWEGKV